MSKYKVIPSNIEERFRMLISDLIENEKFSEYFRYDSAGQMTQELLYQAKLQKQNIETMARMISIIPMDKK